MPLKINSKGKAETTKVTSDKGTVLAEETKSEAVEVPKEVAAPVASGPMCEVGFDASYTHNLGNYQSAKVGISLKIPCQHPEIDTVYTYAQEWVNKRMEALIEELGEPAKG